MHPMTIRLGMAALALALGWPVAGAEILPAYGSVPEAPSGSPYRERVKYCIWLKSGTCVRSATLPMVAFGAVRYKDMAGRATQVATSSVDLERSRSGWYESTQWDVLDRSEWLGRRLPAASYVDTAGTTHSLSDGSGWRLIEMYRSYCLICHAQLATTRDWRRQRELEDALQVLAICVDCTPSQLASIVSDRKLGSVTGWVNARFASEPAWVQSTLGGSAKMNFLVGPDGRVRHARMHVREGDLFPNVLDVLASAEIAGKGEEP
jgi:hypothetical protein